LPEESGSSTEIALLKFIDRCQYDIQDIRAKNEIIQKMPFSSSRKRMSSLLMSHGKMMLYVKGASEIVLEGCNKL
jgi:magnesium-transporting ATPase (P-type)